MVVNDIASIEFNPENDEICMSSHHVFKANKQKRKRIVATVSIIFVQPEFDKGDDKTAENDSPENSDLFSFTEHKGSGEETAYATNDPIKLDIPSSLSVIQVPFGPNNGMSWNWTGLSPFNVHSGQSKTSNKSLSENLDKSLSSKENDEHVTAVESVPERSTGSCERAKHSSVSVIDLSGDKCASEYVPPSDVPPSDGASNHSEKDKNLSQKENDVLGDAGYRIVTPNRKKGNIEVTLPATKTRNSSIRSAIKNSHPSNKPICYICGEYLDSFEKMIGHCEVHNLSRECPVCGVKFSATCNLKRHCLGHVSKTAFSCPVCPAIYRRKDNLHVHMEKHNIYKFRKKSYYMKFLNTKKQMQQYSGVEYSRTNRPPVNIKRSDNNEKYPGAEENQSLDEDMQPFLSSTGSISEYSNHQEMELEHDHSKMDANKHPHDVDVADPVNESNGTIQGNVESDIESPMPYPGFVAVENDTMILHRGTSEINNKTEKKQKESIINYSCSTCKLKFSNLESVKKHAVIYHGEKLPTKRTEADSELQYLAQSNVNTDIVKIEDTDLDAVEQGIVFSDPLQFATSFSADSMKSSVSFSPSSVNDDAVNRPSTSTKDNEDKDSRVSSVRYSPYGIEQVNPKNSGLQNESDMDSNTANTKLQTGIPSQSHVSQPSQNLSVLFLGGSPISSLPVNILPKKPESETVSDALGHMYVKMNQSVGQPKPISKLAGPGNSRRTGLGSRLPVCKFCGQYLDTWEMIIDHLKHHQDILKEKYSCVVCETIFSSKDCLRRHAINHMGIRFQCNVCSNAYSRKDNLQKHMREAHSIYLPHSYQGSKNRVR